MKQQATRDILRKVCEQQDNQNQCCGRWNGRRLSKEQREQAVSGEQQQGAQRESRHCAKNGRD